MARTRPSPICCATSAVISTSLPPSSTVNCTAWLISGSAPRGNSTSTTGPAMATTLPSFSSVSVSAAVSVTVMSVPRVERFEHEVFGNDLVEQQVFLAACRLPQGLGTTDDLHDLRGDRVLAGPVHGAAEVRDEVFRVVGRGLHGSLSGRVLGS